MITSRVLYKSLLIFTGLILVLAGCGQERTSEDAPIHLNPNMDNQPRYEPQGESRFFANGMNDRPTVDGTIARGQLITDMTYNTGRNSDSSWVKVAPVPLTMELLERGRQRFDIYCSPCHGRIGDSKGIIGKRGMLPPPTFHSDSLRNMGDGYLFEVITKGRGNMPSYSYQVPVPDRWAIVYYLRALQRSQKASFSDLPIDTTQTFDTILNPEESSVAK